MNALIEPTATAAPDDAMLARLVARLRHQIPLTAAMQLEAGSVDDGALVLRAPLAPNVNDKGCAFGGSLASLMTLAAWAAIELRLEARGLDCDVYVQDSSIDYLVPVWGELQARATLAEDQSWEAFFSALAMRGKGRIGISVEVAHAGRTAARLRARFVAKCPAGEGR